MRGVCKVVCSLQGMNASSIESCVADFIRHDVSFRELARSDASQSHLRFAVLQPLLQAHLSNCDRTAHRDARR